jgi:hypothetical protein
MGLGMARALRRRGLSVTLLERGQPGRAASWASAGIIGATVREESDPSYQLRRVSEALRPSPGSCWPSRAWTPSTARQVPVSGVRRAGAGLAGRRRGARTGRGTGSASSPATVLAGSSTRGVGAHDAGAVVAQDDDARASSGPRASSGAIANTESKVTGESSGGSERSSGLAQPDSGIAQWSGPQVLDGGLCTISSRRWRRTSAGATRGRRQC